MNLRARIEALYDALAAMDTAIGAMEAVREKQELRGGSISSESLENLLTERETMVSAVALMEKLIHARRAIAPAHHDAVAGDLTSRRRCGPVWRRHCKMHVESGY